MAAHTDRCGYCGHEGTSEQMGRHLMRKHAEELVNANILMAPEGEAQ